MPRYSQPERSRNPEPEIIYTAISFRSPYREGNLKTIELVGVPGQRLKNGELVVSQKTQRFFDDLIVGKLFALSSRLPIQFQEIKIWLYDTNASEEERGYKIPDIDNRDLPIFSNVPFSKLEAIYILDNELSGAEYQKWARDAQQLFTPIFKEFIAPPEPPDILANNPIFQAFQTLGETLDPKSKAKRKILFNALIVQID